MQPDRDGDEPSELDTSPIPDYSSLLRLDGRGFIVFGAGRGLGRQSAHALAQAGARLACVDNSTARAEKVAAEVNGVALTADVTRRADVERALEQAEAALGGVRGLVDVVGMVLGGTLADVSDDQYQREFDIVLKHAFLAMQLGGQAIASAGGGAMAFVGSIAGVGYSPGVSIYSAAKAALHHMVTSAANEFAPQGVRVNVVSPALVRTPRIGVGRGEDHWAVRAQSIPRGTVASTSEIASVILFLCSDLASNVTGQTLVADGGVSGRNWPDRFAR